jgi:hypothetical protein
MAEDQKYLPLKEAINYVKENDLKELSEKIEEITKDHPTGKERRRILKPLIVVEMEKFKILKDFIEKYWKNAKTPEGQKILRRYKNKYTDMFENDETEEDDFEETSEFAYEEDLKYYLVSNLSLIENGLKLFVDKDGIEGIEYSVDEKHKRIDILAIDKNNDLVIIELKVSKGYEKVIGQCLYYKNKLMEKLKLKKVRIMIIARNIDERLKIAVKGLSDVELFEYSLNVLVKKINERVC